MKNIKERLRDNEIEIVNNLSEQNDLYKERIELLERELRDKSLDKETNSNNGFFDLLKEIDSDTNYSQTKHENDSKQSSKEKNISILTDIDLPIENTNNDEKDTSLRISKETKQALEEVRFDFMEHYKVKISYSQTIFLLLEIYNKNKHSQS